MSKVNTEHIVRLVLEVDLYKRPNSIPIITVFKKDYQLSSFRKMSPISRDKSFQLTSFETAHLIFTYFWLANVRHFSSSFSGRPKQLV